MKIKTTENDHIQTNNDKSITVWKMLKFVMKPSNEFTHSSRGATNELSLFFPFKYRFYCVYVNVKCGKKCVWKKNVCFEKYTSLFICDTMTQIGVNFRFLSIAKMLQSDDSKVWISAAKHTVFRKNLFHLLIYEIKRKTNEKWKTI